MDFSNPSDPKLIWFAGPTEGESGFVGLESDLVDWDRFVHPDERTLFPALFKTTIDTGESVAEYRFLQPHGRYRRVRIHAGLSRTPANTKGPTVVVAIKDLDKLRRAEDLVVGRTRDLKQSRVQLREARRLAWLGTVAQIALLCEDQPEERGEGKKALQDIEYEAKRCGTIVRGIRRFARGEGRVCIEGAREPR